MFSGNASGAQRAIAVVSNNIDPLRQGRIKVTCSALLGDESSELPGWIEPALPWGWFIVPDVGQQVTILFTEETSSDVFRGESSITHPNIQWEGATHFTGPLAVDGNPIGSEFTIKNYTKRRGFKTPAGHVLLFDDSQHGREVRMSWSGGTPATPKSAFWSFDNKGSFAVQDAGGNVFYMNAKKTGSLTGEVSMIHKSGNRISIDDDGISMVDKHGNAIVMNAAGISIVSQGPINVMGSDMIVQNGLHFSGPDGIPCNVGGVVNALHPLTAANAPLKPLALVGSLPADGTAVAAALGAVAAL